MSRQMKDSGIEWIGEIPKQWEYTKLKYHYVFEKGKNAAIYTQDYIGQHVGDYPVYSGQTENDGVMGRIDAYDYDIEECLFTTTVGAKVMTPKVLRGKFSLSQNCLIMKRKDMECNRYYYYLLLSLFDYEKSMIPSYMQPSLRIDDLNTYSFFIPVHSEQKRIALFLDSQCAHIDAVIEKTKASVEEYKKLKQAVITQAVTKGIRGKRPMKDSGIEFVGEIPADWDVVRNSFLFRENVRTPDEDAISLSLSQVDGLIATDDMKESSLKTSTYDGWKQVRLNDLVLNRFKGHLGVLYSASIEGMVSFHYGVYEPIKGFNSKFFEYLYHSEVYKGILGLKSNGMTIGLQNLSNQNFYSVQSIYPSIEEQNEIIEYLDRKLEDINKLVEKKVLLIKQLEEYKKSLIYEYVTGKKEVPQPCQ